MRSTFKNERKILKSPKIAPLTFSILIKIQNDHKWVWQNLMMESFEWNLLDSIFRSEKQSFLFISKTTFESLKKTHLCTERSRSRKNTILRISIVALLNSNQINIKPRHTCTFQSNANHVMYHMTRFIIYDWIYFNTNSVNHQPNSITKAL